MITILAASGDLFSLGNNLATKLGHLALAFVALGVGLIVAGHIGRHNVGAAIVVVLLALIPVWFLADPQGAMNTLTSTVNSL